jgi:hypothetical protein
MVGIKQKVCERHGIRAKVSEETQIIFKNYLEFQEEGGRTSWDKVKEKEGERWVW